jgi:hypothetical protein
VEQVSFAVVFFLVDGLICATVIFAGSEQLFRGEGLCVWVLLVLSCAAVPLAGRIKTRAGAVASILVALMIIAGLVFWFSRYA